MDSSDELVSSATAEDIVELAADGGSIVLEAAGMRSDGTGGLAWMASSDGPSAIVRNKFRMMCAMLNDRTRARCYADAIEQAVKRQLLRTGECTVLDIGTGFGFLGLLAARAGATVVVACEMNQAVADAARVLVRELGLEQRMSVHAVRSDELSSSALGERQAHIILTETLDSELLCEGIVPTLRHAQSAFLDAAQGIVIPARAEVYAELVGVNPALAPTLSQLNTSGVLRWGALDSDGMYAPVVDIDTWVDCEQAAPLLIQADELRRTGTLRSLSAPVCVHALSFGELDALPERCEATISLTSIAAGRCDGLLLWWRLQCATTEQSASSAASSYASGSTPWCGTVPGAAFQDHWHSALHPIGEPLELTVGCQVSASMRSNDTRISVQLERPVSTEGPPTPKPTSCSAESSAQPPHKRPRAAPRAPRLDAWLAFAPAASESSTPASTVERVWELCDRDRTIRYANAIRKALRDGPQRATVLDVSDGCLCACIAAGILSNRAPTGVGQSGGASGGVVLSLEHAANSPDVPRRMWRSFVQRLQATYGVEVTLLDASCAETQTLRDAIDAAAAAEGDEVAPSAGGDASGGAPAGGLTLVVAEPYYHCCAGRHTLSALGLYYQLKALRPLAHVAGCDVVPQRAAVHGVAVRFGEMLSAYGPLGPDVAGIDHTPLDKMWEGCRERSMCFHLWQYAHEIVSARPVELLELDYHGALQPHTADPTALSSRRNVAMQLAAGADTVDAVAVSVEFDLRSSDGRGAAAVGHDQLSQHSRREVFLLPQHARRVGDATLHFAVLIEDGALRLDFGAE